MSYDSIVEFVTNFRWLIFFLRRSTVVARRKHQEACYQSLLEEAFLLEFALTNATSCKSSQVSTASTRSHVDPSTTVSRFSLYSISEHSPRAQLSREELSLGSAAQDESSTSLCLAALVRTACQGFVYFAVGAELLQLPEDVVICVLSDGMREVEENGKQKGCLVGYPAAFTELLALLVSRGWCTESDLQSLAGQSESGAGPPLTSSTHYGAIAQRFISAHPGGAEAGGFDLAAHLWLSRLLMTHFFCYNTVEVKCIFQHVHQLQHPLESFLVQETAAKKEEDPAASSIEEEKQKKQKTIGIEEALLNWIRAVVRCEWDFECAEWAGDEPGERARQQTNRRGGSPTRILSAPPPPVPELLTPYQRLVKSCLHQLNAHAVDFYEAIHSGLALFIVIRFYDPNRVPNIGHRQFSPQSDSVEPSSPASVPQSSSFWSMVLHYARHVLHLCTPFSPSEALAYGESALALHLFALTHALFHHLSAEALRAWAKKADIMEEAHQHGRRFFSPRGAPRKAVGGLCRAAAVARVKAQALCFTERKKSRSPLRFGAKLVETKAKTKGPRTGRGNERLKSRGAPKGPGSPAILHPLTERTISQISSRFHAVEVPVEVVPASPSPMTTHLSSPAACQPTGGYRTKPYEGLRPMSARESAKTVATGAAPTNTSTAPPFGTIRMGPRGSGSSVTTGPDVSVGATYPLNASEVESIPVVKETPLLEVSTPFTHFASPASPSPPPAGGGLTLISSRPEPVVIKAQRIMPPVVVQAKKRLSPPPPPSPAAAVERLSPATTATTAQDGSEEAPAPAEASDSATALVSTQWVSDWLAGSAERSFGGASASHDTSYHVYFPSAKAASDRDVKEESRHGGDVLRIREEYQTPRTQELAQTKEDVSPRMPLFVQLKSDGTAVLRSSSAPETTSVAVESSIPVHRESPRQHRSKRVRGSRPLQETTAWRGREAEKKYLKDSYPNTTSLTSSLSMQVLNDVVVHSVEGIFPEFSNSDTE